MKRLDPLTVPLRGLHLIEASAGTGKTYAIAGLYLRLLLDGLAPDRILVVTYTNAATEELRERIRARVVEALQHLGVGNEREEPDELLRGILEGLQDREAARVLLAEAVTRMDEAAVHTIHGFCQRALQEQAFETGTPFEAEFLTEEMSLRHRVMEDFWRLRVAVMNETDAAWVRANWASPADLLRTIASGLSREDLRLLPEDAAASLVETRERIELLLERLRAAWTEEREQVVALLQTSGSLNRRSYTRAIVKRAIEQVDALMARAGPLDELPADFCRFTPALMEKQTKPGQATPDHAFFRLCGELEPLPEQLRNLGKAAFLIEARGYCLREMERRKAAARQLFFDDLLRRLDQALGEEGGEVLAARLRSRCPVALIDEFQDTDPRQYRIFRRIYAGRPECGLYLIGDPKQAIYAFRGADIFTYIRARRDTESEGAQHTLRVNWRSSGRLVRTVNRLFERSAAPFVYQRDIPFRPVEPGPKADEAPLRIQGQVPAPLNIWFLRHPEGGSKRLAKGDAGSLAAEACAARIADLLNLGMSGEASLGDRNLLAKDMAVLVRTHSEGSMVQAALRRFGVASVSLSQDSVFESEEAGDLLQVLAAVADGADEGLIRGAAATSLIGLPVSEIDRLSQDERAWEGLLERFQDYRDQWRTQGVMGALQALIHGEQAASRLLSWPDGERRLTNLLQLSELLQVAEQAHPGPDALLRWLADQRANPPPGDEASQLRLESDDALVRIVTMHKSKGLEYPVVFLPFPWSSFALRGGPVLFHDPKQLSACLDLGSKHQAVHRGLAEVEELAQRLRLLYVAVTRAKHLCCLCWGPVNMAESSALAWLLHPGAEANPPASRMKGLDERALLADLHAFAADAEEYGGAVSVEDLPSSDVGRVRKGSASVERLSESRLKRGIPKDWRVASYSWLANGAEGERPDHDQQQPEEDGPLPTEVDTAGVDDIFRFPRGTEAGHFLHSLFENLDFPAACGAQLERTTAEILARYGLDGQWEPVVSRTAERVLETPLDDSGMRLRQVERRDRLNELEFHFEVSSLTPEGLRRGLAPFPAYRDAADGLAFEKVRGLMKGFIDLVFRAEGRWYIVDYKSNHLGDRLENYSPPALVRAIRLHRYDLQYLIYTLALHRWLGQRLPDYDYETHFGGVYYLFLRGMRPEEGPRYGVFRDRPARAVVEDLDALVRGNAADSADPPRPFD